MPAFATTHVAVLEQRRERLEVRVARLLDVHARHVPERGREPLAPLAGRADAAGRGAGSARARRSLATSRRAVRRTGPRTARSSACSPSTSTSGRAGRGRAARGAPRTRRAGAARGRRRSAASRSRSTRSPVDAVVAREVVAHDVVLDDVARRSAARSTPLPTVWSQLATYADDREPEPPRGEEERARRLRVWTFARTSERAVRAHPLEQRRRHVSARREVPAADIARSSHCRPRQRARAGGVEEPVRVPVAHPLAVEAVAAVEPDRERVVARVPVERRGRPGAGALDAPRRAPGAARRRARTGTSPDGAAHTRGLVRAARGCAASRSGEPLRAARRRSRSRRRPASGAGRGGRPRSASVTASRARGGAAIRSASDAPSSRWKRSASCGVPHAGQPSTPKTVDAAVRRSAAADARRRARRPARGPRARRRASNGRRPPRASPRRRGSATACSRPRRRRRRARATRTAEQRLVQHHRPVREEHRVVAVAQDRAASRLRELAGRELDPTRRRPDREPDRDALLRLLDRPAQERARLLGVRRAARSSCSGSAARSETSRSDWCDLPGPGGDEARVVERVDDLRPLARLVVDLLVRARGEEATRTSSRPGGGRGARARPRSRPCPARRSRTRRSGPGTRARSARMRQSEARSASSTTSSVVRRGELDERLAVGLDDVLVRDLRTRVPSPALGLALERSGRALLERRRPARRGEPVEPELAQPRVDPLDELRDSARSNDSSSGAPACQRYVPPPSARAPRVLHEGDALALDRARDERLRRRRPRRGRTRTPRRSAAWSCPSHVRDVPAEGARASPRGRRARGSPPSACPTGARCGRRRPRARRAARAPRPGAPPSSGPPAARRRRSSRPRRPPRPRCRFAQAIPRPFEMPIPSEPELASIPGTPTSGCPSRPPSRRSRSSCSVEMTPSATQRRVETRERRGPSTRRRRRGSGLSKPSSATFSSS